MKCPRWLRRNPRSATFDVLTNGRRVHTVTITLGGTIYIDQPVEIFLGDETHVFHLRDTVIRWVK